MSSKERLYFLDALRAFAILMMLQGHFISGILAPVFKLETIYFMIFGFIAEDLLLLFFFVVTGWVVMFLLLRNEGPRVSKSKN